MAGVEAVEDAGDGEGEAAVAELDPSPGGGGPGRPVTLHTGQRQSWTVMLPVSSTCSTRSVRPQRGQWPTRGADELLVVSGLGAEDEALSELAVEPALPAPPDGLDELEGLV